MATMPSSSSHQPRGGEEGSRNRSRSPFRDYREIRRRSRSPHRRLHAQRREEKAAVLPLGARHLHKHDLKECRALLAQYLDVQKGLDIKKLPEDEVKGRWKSFLGKWNRGELAEGWYLKATRQKREDRSWRPAAQPRESSEWVERTASQTTVPQPEVAKPEESDNDEDEDDYGPTPPPRTAPGAAVPSLQDLALRREEAAQDRSTAAHLNRQAYKAERRAATERLDELAPRAQAGTRERQIEKKADVAASNRAFRDAKEAGDIEIKESDLLGDDRDEYRKLKKQEERKKNEREIRKEEVLRAKAAEREERLAEARRKEERTMEGLRELARARFGG